MPADMLAKRFFAKTYRWTEDQTEDASLDALNWFPVLEKAENRATEIRQRQESQQQRRQ